MSNVAVLLYADADNPMGVPAMWPARVRPLAANEFVQYPEIEMTVAQYDEYRAEHQSEYDAWEYQYDLKLMKGEMEEKLWKSAYDYNFQFFSLGAYAQILELKLAGVSRAAAAQGWILTLWSDYYQRKALCWAALTHEAVQGTNIDFSNHGTPPFTIPEMLAEAAQMGLL